LAFNRRRGFIERIWQTEILQSSASDLLGLGGLVAIGVGIWQYSPAATCIYAGAVAVVASVLISIDRARTAAAASRRKAEAE
jgi:hypothetical protein